MSRTFAETHRVRFRDTDAQGHMFFANYLVFADEVAGNFMRTLGFDWSEPDLLPTFVFTANANCDYLHECLSGDEVRVEVSYTRVGNTSATLGFTLTREADKQLLAQGSFVQVFVERESRRPTPVPELVRLAFEESAG